MREWGIITSVVMLLITSAFAAAGIFMLLGADTNHRRLLGIGALAFFGSCIPFSSLKLWQAIVRNRTSDTDSPDTIRIFARSKGDLVALTVMCAGMGIGCYLLPEIQPAKESVRLVGWFGVAMCGFGALVIPIMAILRPFRLVLSPRGLDFTLFKVGPIEWPDIAAARVGQLLGTEFVSLELVDQEKYFARGFPKRGRKVKWLGASFSSPFVMTPQQLGASADAILTAINLRLSAFGCRKTIV